MKHNIYFSEFYKFMSQNDDMIMKPYSIRCELVKKYSWAVPNCDAIEVIIHYKNIVEMGAGTGYWASLIESAGADIIAYDENPPLTNKNNYFEKYQYFNVLTGYPTDLQKHGDRALLLCWPPYDTEFALECLNNWNGDTLIYVGEGVGGCCGNDSFFEKLEKEFTQVDKIDIPQWLYIYDALYVYKRRK